MTRDFTYIDDIVEAIYRLIKSKNISHEIYNIGRGKPEKLMDFISSIEKHLGLDANMFLSMQKEMYRILTICAETFFEKIITNQ